jgi:hypothetical protein
MDWQKLDLTKASVVKREVDVVMQKLSDISNGTSNLSDNAKANFFSSVQERIQELENFYLLNTDDERAILFEKERLRLRKALQPFHSTRESKSVAASEKSISAATSSLRLEKANSFNNINKSLPLSQSQIRLNQPTLSPTPGETLNFGQSPTASRRSPMGPDKKIYGWENGKEKSQRGNITLENFSYEPTSTPGFYSRQLENLDVDEMDKFIDFQIVLTQEEMTALAARKKAQKLDGKLHKSQAAALSVHAATPYVDPKRIAAEMLRPGHPDRWIHY